MKFIVLLVVLAAAIIGMVTVTIQQASAPRTCGSCAEFKKFTHDFEKAVIGAVQPPETE
jgi:hypothetical protein